MSDHRRAGQELNNLHLHLIVGWVNSRDPIIESCTVSGGNIHFRLRDNTLPEIVQRSRIKLGPPSRPTLTSYTELSHFLWICSRLQVMPFCSLWKTRLAGLLYQDRSSTVRIRYQSPCITDKWDFRSVFKASKVHFMLCCYMQT